jgi:cytochrome c oxidase subunit 3
VLGVLFVLAQVRAWRTGWLEGAGPATGGYAAAYFALTGLHALHVLGGLLVLGALLLRAGQPLEAGAMGLGALYWHFMGALWLVLVALFLLGRYG